MRAQPQVIAVAALLASTCCALPLQAEDDGLDLQRFRSVAERPPFVSVFGDGDALEEHDLIFFGAHGGDVPDEEKCGIIMSRDGTPLWMSASYGQINNLRLQALNGTPALTFWSGSRAAAVYSEGRGRGMILDSSYRVLHSLSIKDLPGSDIDIHEFQLAEWTEEDGSGRRPSALVATNRIAPSLVGSSWGAYVLDTCFYEIDVATEETLFHWCPSEHVSRDVSYEVKLVFGFLESYPYDFFHLNTAVKDEFGNYLISGRAIHALYYVDRNGETLWVLHGHAASGHGDFVPEEGGGDVSFGWQHHASWVDPGLLGLEARSGERYISLFDNGGQGFFLLQTRSHSRGIILRIDEARRTFSLFREFLPPPELEARASSSQGSVQVLPSGDVLVGFGKEPWSAVYTLDGKIRMTTHRSASAETYREFSFPWRAQPAESPALSVALDEEGRVHLYASWNGATEVVRWRVYGGDRPEFLSDVLLEAPKEGFETRLTLQNPQPAPPWVQIAALSSTGTELARSEPRSGQTASPAPRVTPALPATGFAPPPPPKDKWTIDPMGLLYMLEEWLNSIYCQ